MTNSCRICDYIQGKNIAEGIDVAWFQDDHYAAFISQGAMVKGWTVIFPKKHELNMLEHYKDARFWTFLDAVNRKLSNLFGECVFFEHGSLCDTSVVGCGTYHAHVHVVPLNINLQQASEAFDKTFDWQEVDISEFDNITNEYLLLSNIVPKMEGKVSVTFPLAPTSQFFRRVIAKELGISTLYNYKIDKFLENGEESLRLIKQADELCSFSNAKKTVTSYESK